jgi:hypothetical protein
LLIAPYCITSEFPYLGQVRGSQGPNSENWCCASDSVNKSSLSSLQI